MYKIISTKAPIKNPSFIGKCGINTITPQQTLDINGTLHCSDILYVGNDNNSSNVGSIGGQIRIADTYGDSGFNSSFNTITSRNYAPSQASELVIYKGNNNSDYESNSDRIRLRSGMIVFDTFPNSVISESSQPNFNENIRMVVASNGNVGIGTIIPSSLLEVNGTAKITSTLNLSSLTSGVMKINTNKDVTTSTITNDDIDTNASISDTKLATISSGGKVANSATTATTDNNPNTIVLRNSAGNIIGNKNLTIGQAGDQFGNTYLHLRNRVGEAGVIYETTGIQVVDFIFKHNGGQKNIRLEGRSTGKLGINTWHIGGTDIDNPQFAISDTRVGIQNKLTIGTFIEQNSNLHIEGTAKITSTLNLPSLTPGVMKINTDKNVTSSTITNDDIAPNASISDTKLAQISTGGKVANSATTATTSNIADSIVLRNSAGNIENPSLSGLVQIEKLLEKITPITMSNSLYTLDFLTSTANTLYCSNPGTSDLTLNITNLSISGSGSISISILIDTSTNKKYFKTVQLNGVTQTQISIGGYNNLSIDGSATFVLQQINLIYVNSTILKIFTSLLSIW